MPLDALARANSKTEAMNEAFGAIGHGAPVTMPRSKRNQEPLAWELFCAKFLRKAAEAREALAIKAAIKAGVIFDHKLAPEPDGTARVVYEGDVVRIDLKVTTGREGVDHDGFVESLLAAGVAPKLLDKLAVKHATVSAAPHSFTPSLVTK
jgi:hypothetical protein